MFRRMWRAGSENAEVAARAHMGHSLVQPNSAGMIDHRPMGAWIMGGVPPMILGACDPQKYKN